jgi:D-glycero-D-manno-heptose 1,7-bisphosphate phosphatase
MYLIQPIPEEANLCANWEIVNPQITVQSRHLFLDRDGVVIQDYGYVNSMDNTEFIAPMIEMMQLANLLGVPISIITNQAGVAHGFFTEPELLNYNLELLNHLFVNFDITINALFYCPSHPEAEISQYRRKCQCRKPMNGLFIRANDLSPIDFAKSIYVGDKTSDEMAANSLRLKYWNYDTDADIQLLEDWIRQDSTQ